MAKWHHGYLVGQANGKTGAGERGGRVGSSTNFIQLRLLLSPKRSVSCGISSGLERARGGQWPKWRRWWWRKVEWPLFRPCLVDCLNARDRRESHGLKKLILGY